jgi:hypothetical protein
LLYDEWRDLDVRVGEKNESGFSAANFGRSRVIRIEIEVDAIAAAVPQAAFFVHPGHAHRVHARDTGGNAARPRVSVVQIRAHIKIQVIVKVFLILLKNVREVNWMSAEQILPSINKTIQPIQSRSCSPPVPLDPQSHSRRLQRPFPCLSSARGASYAA